MRTTDNTIAKPLLIEDSHLQNLQIIADINIAEITIENSDNLLIFPSCLKKSRDKIGNEKVFKLKGRYLHTGNIMGFVGVNNSELIIQSRFAQDDKQDYFLHYMLQKVFCINLFDMKHSSSNIYNIFDFLLYLFPHFLNKALRQGLFKEYINKEYNNSRLRGALDTKRHLRLNMTFAGKLEYITRE